MMNKLAILCASSILLASTAQAGWEGNWLVGVTGGGAAQDGDYELNFALSTPATTTVTKHIDQSEFIWGLLAGYQARCNCWLLGAEVNVDWRDYLSRSDFAFTDTANVGWAGTAEYKQDLVVGLTGRVGYEIIPGFMPYIRLGAETSHDRLTNCLLNSPLTASGYTTGSHRQYRVVAGVGAEMPILLCGLTFRLEYNYYSEGKGVDSTGYASDGTTYIDSNITVRTNAGKASLVYNFM